MCYAYVDPDKPVLVVGDPEQSNDKCVRWENGIKLNIMMLWLEPW